MINIQNLNYVYKKSGIHALNDITFDISQGESSVSSVQMEQEKPPRRGLL